MSFSFGNFSLGSASGAGRLAGGMTRGRMQGGNTQGVNYPSPFFDVAHTYLPTTVKQMFKFCRYYFMTNPLINAIVCKLSEYPVTDIVIDHEDPEVVRRWTEYFNETIRFRSFQIECGLDYHAYGTSAVSLSFPFQKYLTCTACGFSEQARKIRENWIYSSHEFRLTCPKCGQTGAATPKDWYYRDASAIKPVRWNAEDIEVSYNDITGDCTYFYTMPAPVRADVTLGKKDIVETMPQIFLQAMRQEKGVVFSKANLFTMKRPGLATQDRGWGTPLILPVLKDTFYLQIMKKAQECVAPGTLLETPAGLQPAGSLGVGDIVRSHTGAWRHITQKKLRPMLAENGDYAVKFSISGLRQLPSTVSNTHPIYVLRRNQKNRRIDTKEHRRSSYMLRNPSLYDLHFVDAGEIEVGQYVGYPIARSKDCTEVDLASYAGDFAVTEKYVYSGVSLATATAFESLEAGERVLHNNAGRVAKRAIAAGDAPKRAERWLELDEDLAYIAGWYVGDGSIGARRVDFSMGPDDNGVELEQAIDRVFGCVCTHTPSETSRGWNLCASETIFSQFFSNWIPGGSHEKRIPREVLEAPNAIVLAFFRGYLEADGWTRGDGSRIAACLCNGGLAYQLWQLSLSLRCIATVSERESTETTITNRKGKKMVLSAGRPVFQFAVNTASALRLCGLMEGRDVDSIETGKSGFFLGDYFLGRINSVECVPCSEVISFEVEEEHTFCLPGMATHNSILLEHIVPLRILFPQAGSGTTDPFTTINLLDWRDQVAMEIARWRMDCVTPDSLVESAKGIVRADDVCVGDQLRNHLGQLSTVEKVWRRPLREGERAYQVVVRGLYGAVSTVSEGHPFMARRKYNNGNGHKLGDTTEFIRAKNLRVGDYVGYPIPEFPDHDKTHLDLAGFVTNAATEKWVYYDHQETAVPDAFEYLENCGSPEKRQPLLEEKGWSINQYKTAQMAIRGGRTPSRIPRHVPFDEELCWVLGLYLAEGNTTPKQVLFALHAKETAYIDRLNVFFKKNFDATGFTAEKSAEGIQRVYSSTLAAQFFHALCVGVSTTKRVHNLLKYAGEDRVRALLRGYFDGDGCYHEKGDTIHRDVTTASRQLAADVRELLLAYGMISSLTYIAPASYNICGRLGMAHGAYKIQLGSDAAHHFDAWLAHTGLPSTARCTLGVFADRCFWHRIDEIREVEAAEVIGFQMDHAAVVRLDDDTEAHGTFCLWGSASCNTNYIPILPLPIGNQTIGGDGKALLMSQEMQMQGEQIIMGMGVPREFLQGGMCLTTDSLLCTSSGLLRLDELVGDIRKGQVTAVQTHAGVHTASQGHDVGKKKVWRVTTRSGLELTGAGTHPLYVLNADVSADFTQIEQISAGAHVGVKVGAELWPTEAPQLQVSPERIGGRYANVTLDTVTVPSVLTAELARLLGYLVAEGSCVEDHRISFSITDKDTAEDFAHCLFSVFGIRPAVAAVSYARPADGKQMVKYATEVGRQTVVELLQKLGLKHYAQDKVVPTVVRHAPRALVIEFLRAYFDGDGGGGTYDGRSVVTATSTSWRLLQEVQLLLLNLGIVSTRYPAYAGKSAATLHVRAEFAQRFATVVGFVSARKQALTLDYNESAVVSPDKLPGLREALLRARERHVHGFGSWKFEPVDLVLDKHEYTTEEIAALVGRDSSTVRIYIRTGKIAAELRTGASGRFSYHVVSRAELQRFLAEHGLGKRRSFRVHQYAYTYDRVQKMDLAAVQQLEPALHQNLLDRVQEHFFWDEVVTVEELELEECMQDIGVEDVHSYQAGGILCHNSYAGTNVSMRMLENQFLSFIGRQKQMANWVMNMVAQFMGWPKVNVRFKPFKMADDMQRKSYLFQLNQGNKISDTTLLADADLDIEEENDIMLQEASRRLAAVKKQQLAMAEIQGESQVIMMKMQAQAQQAMQAAQTQPSAPGEPGVPQNGPMSPDQVGQLAQQSRQAQETPMPMPPVLPTPPTDTEGAGSSVPAQAQSLLNRGQDLGTAPGGEQMPVDIIQLADAYAKQIAQLDPDMQESALNALAAQSQDLADLVQEFMAKQQGQAEVAAPMFGGATGGPATGGIDQRPLPEKLPPRRAQALV
jgi:intein/homing endonuclease